MVKVRSKGQDTELNKVTLKSIITSVVYDYEAQQAVLFYQPVTGYDVVFTIIPVELDEPPYIVTIDSLGLTAERIINEYVRNRIS